MLGTLRKKLDRVLGFRVSGLGLRVAGFGVLIVPTLGSQVATLETGLRGPSKIVIPPGRS